MVHRKLFQCVLIKNVGFLGLPFCEAQASQAFRLLCLLAMSSRLPSKTSLRSGSTLLEGEKVIMDQQVKDEQETQEMQSELADTLFLFGKFYLFEVAKTNNLQTRMPTKHCRKQT